MKRMILTDSRVKLSSFEYGVFISFIHPGNSFGFQRMNELQNADSENTVENSSFLSYLLSHESLTTKEAAATAVDLLVGATETVCS